MGWSCRADAAKTMERWTEACLASTGVQNVIASGGRHYLVETSRVEHDDGAITGSVLRYDPGFDPKSMAPAYARAAGSFRIGGCGCIARAPAFLRGLGPSECGECRL